MPEETEFRYDVFISYRWQPQEDKLWVRERLDPALRAAGLKVCLDVRNFKKGQNEQLEMARAIRESRHGLCVVTPEYFAKGVWAGSEGLLLKKHDPQGETSRLIPFVLRQTVIPDWMSGPIPVDWTDERNHAQEWKNLLRDLKAPNQSAPPPARLDQPPAPPAPAETERRFPLLPSIVAAALLAVAAGVLLYLYPRPPGTRDVEGRVYYVRDAKHTGLNPAKNIFVYVSPRRDLISEPSDKDGRFVIKGVPEGVDASHLGAIDGGVHLPPFPYDQNGVYTVVPRPPKPSEDIRVVSGPFQETRAGECQSAKQVRYVKRYVVSTRLERAQEKKGAELTVTLNDAGDARLLDPYVLEPTEAMNDQLNLYSNSRFEDAAHAWLFHIPEHGIDVKLEICVGSDTSADLLSQKHLRVYYKTQ